ncbi:uncharacterized protein LOC144455615 [Phascolarctos cinereus]
MHHSIVQLLKNSGWQLLPPALRLNTLSPMRLVSSSSLLLMFDQYQKCVSDDIFAEACILDCIQAALQTFSAMPQKHLHPLFSPGTHTMEVASTAPISRACRGMKENERVLETNFSQLCHRLALG